MVHLPPPEELPLREEPELLDLPKPPERDGEEEDEELELGRGGGEADEPEGLLDELPELAEEGLEDDPDEPEPKERWDWVGLLRARALAAILSAFGEVTDLERTESEDLERVEPAVREVIARP